jgi:sulfoxide reductase heme-binding subunit YedZ
MTSLKQILNSAYGFWALLAIPGVIITANWFTGPMTAAAYGDAMHGSGEFAVRLMIFALLITPLRLLFPKPRWLDWLARRRRHLGVAAFSYAALHLLVYLMHLGSFSRVLADLPNLPIWTGWAAFIIFAPLAATSNDWAVRKLKQAWKVLHRWVYVAAIFTFAHWASLEYGLLPALIHFLPLMVLEIYRLWYQFTQCGPQRT